MYNLEYWEYLSDINCFIYCLCTFCFQLLIYHAISCPALLNWMSGMIICRKYVGKYVGNSVVCNIIRNIVSIYLICPVEQNN